LGFLPAPEDSGLPARVHSESRALVSVGDHAILGVAVKRGKIRPGLMFT
jgi:hypothetical protein